MKCNHLMASIALGLFATGGVAQAADGWYVAPSVGYYHSDEDRLTEEGSVFGALGIGKYFGDERNASIEFAVDRTNRSNDGDQGTFANLGASLTYRQFFGAGAFKPYFLVGGGANRHDRDGSETGWDFMAQAGGGLAYDFSERVRGRGEAFYRYDMDDESVPGTENFGDWVVAFGVQVALGAIEAPVEPEPLPTPVPPPAEPHCSELDGDGDGVNDCDDQCPNTAPGTVVGPDGCELQVAIDLRGVEFDFDKSTLRPESVQTLNEAVEVLRQYPDIRVEAAGHTDSIGTDEYNQGLSERRARAVYDYLVTNGIDSNRLTTRGYGESSPIADNATREGRQRNRRTELVVQN